MKPKAFILLITGKARSLKTGFGCISGDRSGYQYLCFARSMNKIAALLIYFVLFFTAASAQKVDSIRVEQSGDFIKIRYKIINSTPGQIYRVRVLCSINGGLNTELKSISGDHGDQVIGGKPEYWVVWDVLRDVEDIKSVDFIVRAELVKDLNTLTASTPGSQIEWDKKRFNVLLALMVPKTGLRFGYMGSFGVSAQVTSGKTEKGDAPNISPQGNDPAFALDITKRIVNKNKFQMHLMAGVQNTVLVFLPSRESTGPVSKEFVPGPELGLLFGVSKVSFGVAVSHHDPGKIEKERDLIATSPLSTFTLAFGMRF